MIEAYHTIRNVYTSFVDYISSDVSHISNDVSNCYHVLTSKGKEGDCHAKLYSLHYL